MDKPVFFVAQENQNKLLPYDQVIKRSVELGVKFGKTNPYHRLRYYIKLSLLPHPIRKTDPNIPFDPDKPPHTVGHFPAWVIDRLWEIEKLRSLGLSANAMKDKLTPLYQDRERFSPQALPDQNLPTDSSQPPETQDRQEPWPLGRFFRDITLALSSIVVIVASLSLFLYALYPYETNQFIKNESKVLGITDIKGSNLIEKAGTVLKTVLYPLSRMSLGLLKISLPDPTLQADPLEITQLGRAFVYDIDGNLVARIPISFESADLLIQDEGLVEQLNADLLDGHHAGTKGGQVLVLDEEGDVNIAGGASFGTNITVGGKLTVKKFVGSGAEITNLSVTNITGTFSSASLPSTLIYTTISYANPSWITSFAWTKITSTPNIVSSVDGVTNDGGNIDLIGGGGISITPNDAANTITISGGGASGFVSLGPATADTDTSANPSLFINDTGGGNLLQLQSGGTDRFVIDTSGDLTSVGNITASGNILPAADSTYDLGDSSTHWKDLYIDRVILGAPGTQTGITSPSSGQIVLQGVTSPTATLTLIGNDNNFHITNEDSAEGIYLGSHLRINSGFTDVRPETDSAIDLGTSSLFWRDAYIDKVFLDTDWSIEGVLGATPFLDTTTGDATLQGSLTIDVGNRTNVGGIDNFPFKIMGDFSSQVGIAMYDTSTVSSPLQLWAVVRGGTSSQAYMYLSPGDNQGRFYLGSGGSYMTGGANLTFIGWGLEPATDSSEDLGTSSLYWAETYTDKLYLNSTATLDGATAGQITSTGNIIPSVDSTDDLGSSTIFWANLNVDDITFDPAAGAVSIGQVGGATFQIVNVDDALQYLRIDVHDAGSGVGAELSSGWSPLLMGSHFAPDLDSTRDSGSTTLFWDETFTDELVLSNVGAAATAADTVRLSAIDLSAGDAAFQIVSEDDTQYRFGSFAQFGGSIISDTDSTDDLGSSSIRWNNIYAVNIFGQASGYAAQLTSDFLSVVAGWDIRIGSADHITFFAGETTFNTAGLDIDLRIEGDNATNLFITDAGLDAVQFTPAGTRASAAGAILDAIDVEATTITITGATNITTATGFNLINISQPTLSAGSALTITNAATFYIADAPVGGGVGPATITNPYALWVDAGNSRFDGQILASDGTAAAPSYSFTSDTNTGFRVLTVGGHLAVVLGGTDRFMFDGDQLRAISIGSVSTPPYTHDVDRNTGIFFPTTDTLGFTAGGVEFLRLQETTQDIVVFNEFGLDIDFRIEGVGQANALFVQGSDGKVGIGDSTPTETLTVADDFVGYAGSFFNDGNLDTHQGVFIQACLDLNPTSSCNFLELRDGDGTVLGAIEGNGAGGVTNASAGSDYAELFRGNLSSFEEGDVIALGSGGDVVKATEGSNLIGVFSSNSNTLGNWVDGWEKSGSWVPVGLLGQIETKVSAENGSIVPGDALTTSSTLGVAMRATESGPIVGKALEAFACSQTTDDGLQPEENQAVDSSQSAVDQSCSGKIMVFVSVGWFVAPLETGDGQLATGDLTDINVQTLAAGTINTDVLFIGDRKLAMSEDGKLIIDGTVNILGDIVIDGDAEVTGDLNVGGTVSAKKLKVSSEVSGNSTLPVGKTKIFVPAPSLTNKSQVSITTTTLTDKNFNVTQKEVGKGFTVEIINPETKNIDFDWFIIN